MSDSVNTKILEVLESIRPALQADGGDLEFLSFNGDNGIVELRLLGACEDVPDLDDDPEGRNRTPPERECPGSHRGQRGVRLPHGDPALVASPQGRLSISQRAWNPNE